jgi:hydroxymethylbilane synthase
MLLEGLVGSIDGKRMLRTRLEGTPDDPVRLGQQAADELISRGAREILHEIFSENQPRQS